MVAINARKVICILKLKFCNENIEMFFFSTFKTQTVGFFVRCLLSCYANGSYFVEKKSERNVKRILWCGNVCNKTTSVNVESIRVW